MISLQRIADAPDAALALVAAGIERQSPSPWASAAPFDPHMAARLALRRYLDGDPLVSGWVALDDGRGVALLGATLEIVTEDHVGYTYLPPRHAFTPLSAWTAIDAESARTILPELVLTVAQDARAHGIVRLLLQTRPHDWVGGAFWRRLGMQPDAVLAGLPLPARRPARAPGHAVRPAAASDADALIRLAFHEYEYHALYTETGSIADQAIEPTRREVTKALTEQAEGKGVYLVVDGPSGEPVGSLMAGILDLPENTPGRAYLPAHYGYIGLTSVAPGARGTGIGGALVDSALQWFNAEGLRAVLLHYIDDNALARPFWSGRGFSPVIVTLAGDVLR